MHKDKATLLKRARAKYVGRQISDGLLKDNPLSPLKNSYFGSLLCCHNLYQSGHNLTTSYCKQRWCPVCNRIRTAKLMSGYLPALQRMKDPYFVTLTKQTVAAADLVPSIELMEKVWRQMLKSDSNKRRKVRGIRKAECTIRPDGLYHYHFHVIIDGKEAAQWLVNAWLSRFSSQVNSEAQDIRPADENSMKEMFKYFTKLITTNKDNPIERELYSSFRMDVVFQAMKGRRSIQPFGGLRPVSEEIEELTAQAYDFLTGEDQIWKWKDVDWQSESGEKLTGYQPSEDFKKLFKNTNPPRLLNDGGGDKVEKN